MNADLGRAREAGMDLSEVMASLGTGAAAQAAPSAGDAPVWREGDLYVVEFSAPEPMSPAAPPVPELAVVREVSGVSLGSGEELRAVVAAAAVTVVPPGALDAATRAAREAAAGSGEYVLGETVTVVENKDPEADDSQLAGKLYITLKLTPAQLAAARPNNVGALYYSPVMGATFVPGVLDATAGTVTVATTHLTVWEGLVGLFRGTPEGEIDRLINEQALETANGLGATVEEELVKGIESNLQLLGLDEDSKSKVLLSVIKSKDQINALASAAADGNHEEASKSLSLLIGKLVVDNVDEGKLPTMLSALVDNPDAVAKVATAAGEDNYWAAVEVCGRAYSETLGITKAIKFSSAAVDRSIRIWENRKLNEVYELYRRSGNKAEFWDDPEVQKNYAGYLRQVQIRDPSSCYGDDRAEDCLTKMFVAREERDTAAEKERSKLRMLAKHMDSYPTLMSDLADRYKDEFGERPTKEQKFDFFMKKMLQIERSLVRAGWEGELWNENRILEGGPKELINAFSTGGEAGLQKEYKRILAERDKHLDIAVSPSPSASPKPSASATPAGQLAAVAYRGVYVLSLNTSSDTIRDRTQLDWYYNDRSQRVDGMMAFETWFDHATTVTLNSTDEDGKPTKVRSPMSVRVNLKGTYDEKSGKVSGKADGTYDVDCYEEEWLGTQCTRVTAPGTFSGAWSGGKFTGTWQYRGEGAAGSGTWRATFDKDFPSYR